MLAYLDALLAAVSRHDTRDIERLLAHPLARILTGEAYREAQMAAGDRTSAVPLRLLQLRHQTAQLLGDRVTAAEAIAFRSAVLPLAPLPQRPMERRVPARQMELPLSA